MTGLCLLCGCPFSVSPRSIRRGEGKFCGRQCFEASRRIDPVARFWSKVLKGEGCWEWQGGLDQDGYGKFTLLGKTVPAHRFAYEVQIGPIPDELWVLHECDNRKCCRGEHLFPGTALDNNRDAMKKGRRRNPGPKYPRRGEQHHKAKLTDAKVVIIRQRCRDGWSYASLAREHGVSDMVIGLIAKGKIWTHLPL